MAAFCVLCVHAFPGVPEIHSTTLIPLELKGIRDYRSFTIPPEAIPKNGASPLKTNSRERTKGSETRLICASRLELVTSPSSAACPNYSMLSNCSRLSKRGNPFKTRKGKGFPFIAIYNCHQLFRCLFYCTVLAFLVTTNFCN